MAATYAIAGILLKVIFFRGNHCSKGLRVPEADSGHPIYYVIQGIQLKLPLGRTQSIRPCSLHLCHLASELQIEGVFFLRF